MSEPWNIPLTGLIGQSHYLEVVCAEHNVTLGCQTPRHQLTFSCPPSSKYYRGEETQLQQLAAVDWLTKTDLLLSWLSLTSYFFHPNLYVSIVIISPDIALRLGKKCLRLDTYLITVRNVRLWVYFVWKVIQHSNISQYSRSHSVPSSPNMLMKGTQFYASSAVSVLTVSKYSRHQSAQCIANIYWLLAGFFLSLIGNYIWQAFMSLPGHNWSHSRRFQTYWSGR